MTPRKKSNLKSTPSKNFVQTDLGNEKSNQEIKKLI